MPYFQGQGLQFPQKFQTGGNPTGFPAGGIGELVVSEVLGKYSTLAKSGKLFTGYAVLTAPVIYSTAAGTGGPLIWNKPGSGVDCHILAIGVAGVVASAAAGAIGFTGNTGQTVAPGSPTAIDASGNSLVGGAVTQMGGVYRIATPTNAGNTFMPLFTVGTAATTAQFVSTWIDVGGGFIIPPGAWGSIAGSATLTTAQLSIGVLWAELPT